MGGGGGGSKPKKEAPPPQAQPIDYGAMMRQASEAAKAQYRDQLAAQIESYPKMEALQLGTIQKISDNLRNPYTLRADAAVDAAAGQTAKLIDSGDRIGTTATRANQIARDAQKFASGATALDRKIAKLGATAMDQRADQVQGARIADISPMQAAQLGNVADVRSRNIRSNAAEKTLMNEARGGGLLGQLEQQASNDLALGRSLSAEQERDAIQSARAGMAARGLGTGNSALAAELLNRERFAAQREAERRAFASGVLGQATGVRQVASDIDFRRQDTNAGRALQSGLANQQTRLALGMQQGQFDQAANAANFAAGQDRAMAEANFRQQAALANQDANQRQVELNRAFLQNANQSGINSEISRGGYALGALGQTANLYGQQAGAYQNAAGLGLNIANQSMANDPYMRAFAPGTTIGGGTLGTSASMIGNTWQGANQMAGNVASFNTNMQATDRNAYYNRKTALDAARITGGATNNAGWMAMMGGMAQGAGALGGGYLAGQSDRREKTDIKKIGKDPLGLNTYEYKYKGDDRKRTGVMAQEVRKVLPEAVEEVEIKGKKRLAIRPTVLGQAYAQAIAADQKIMFPDGYVVGSGKA